MSNFFPKLEDSTDDQLKHMVNELDFRVVPLASDELTRRTLDNLRKTIIDLDQKNGQLQNMIFRLTIIGVTLAVIQTLQVLDSVWKYFQ